MLKKSGSTILFFILVIFVTVSAFSQDEASRQLWDTEFLKKRAGGKATNEPRKNPTYRRTTPKTSPAEEKPVPKTNSPRPDAPPPESNVEKAAGEVLGVTIWKLRPPKSEDNKEARL